MRKSKNNLAAYKKFAKKVTSRLRIIGALDWINSLVFEINEANYFQIGIDQDDNDTFVFLKYVDEEVVDYKCSRDPGVLEKWIQSINESNKTSHL